MGDDPPYLTVGTEVSAKYKGAFCEAKIRKVVRIVKCKVTFKAGLGGALLSDDLIKGTLRVGATVEAKHSEKNQYCEATVNKIQDCSQYTVVFDDGDITTLRRSALCLKSGRHFNESETLDQLPLTHPEHFSNPVVGGRRGVRRRAANNDADKDDSSDEEETPSQKAKKKSDNAGELGKVVCVEISEKKKGKDNWFPALVVCPGAQETVKIRVKDEYLVRSFKDGRYYTVPKKEISAFIKEQHGKQESNSTVLKTAVDKVMSYLDKDELPPHWDRDVLFGTSDLIVSDDQLSDTEGSEEKQRDKKDRFVAQLYKFMDDRGTPINKVPIVCGKDLDLHRLYNVVMEKGGYGKVSHASQWKPVTIKLGFGAMPSTSTINLVKQAYKKFLFDFEDFYKKLGCNLHTLPSATVKPRNSRGVYRGGIVAASKESKKEETEEPKKDQQDEKEKKPAVTIPEPEADSASIDSDGKKSEQSDEPRRSRSRQEVKTAKKDTSDDDKPTEKPIKKKYKKASKEVEKEPPKEEPIITKTEPPSPAPSQVSQGSKKGRGSRKRKEKEDDPPVKEVPVEPEVEGLSKDVKVQLGDKLRVYYPKGHKKVTYEAKVVDANEKTGSYLVHYTGWNTRYDEWIERDRISENASLRTDYQTKSQGKGPSTQNQTPSEGNSESSGPTSIKSTGGKVQKKKVLKTTPSAPTSSTGTRSKTGTIKRKRLSAEYEEPVKKKRVSKKAEKDAIVPSESESETSDSEQKEPPRVSTPVPVTASVDLTPSVEAAKGSTVTEKTIEPEIAPPSLDISKEPTIVKDTLETVEKEKQNQKIDMIQIRSEMKGLDKIVKNKSPSGSSSGSLQTSPTAAVSGQKLDIYEFEEDPNEAPKLKMFSPRSPDKKDDSSKPEPISNITSTKCSSADPKNKESSVPLVIGPPAPAPVTSLTKPDLTPAKSQTKSVVDQPTPSQVPVVPVTAVARPVVTSTCTTSPAPMVIPSLSSPIPISPVAQPRPIVVATSTSFTPRPILQPEARVRMFIPASSVSRSRVPTAPPPLVPSGTVLIRATTPPSGSYHVPATPTHSQQTSVPVLTPKPSSHSQITVPALKQTVTLGLIAPIPKQSTPASISGPKDPKLLPFTTRKQELFPHLIQQQQPAGGPDLVSQPIPTLAGDQNPALNVSYPSPTLVQQDKAMPASNIFALTPHSLPLIPTTSQVPVLATSSLIGPAPAAPAGTKKEKKKRVVNKKPESKKPPPPEIPIAKSPAKKRAKPAATKAAKALLALKLEPMKPSDSTVIVPVNKTSDCCTPVVAFKQSEHPRKIAVPKHSAGSKSEKRASPMKQHFLKGLASLEKEQRGESKQQGTTGIQFAKVKPDEKTINISVPVQSVATFSSTSTPAVPIVSVPVPSLILSKPTKEPLSIISVTSAIEGTLLTPKSSIVIESLPKPLKLPSPLEVPVESKVKVSHEAPDPKPQHIPVVTTPQRPINVEPEVIVSLPPAIVLEKEHSRPITPSFLTSTEKFEPEDMDETSRLNELAVKSISEDMKKEDESCSSLLCEEEIPGSPAADDDDKHRFDFLDEIDDKKTETDVPEPSSSGPGARVRGLPVNRSSESRDKKKSNAQGQVFPTVEKISLGPSFLSVLADNTPPSTPESTTLSTETGGSPHVDGGRISPSGEGGSSKSKESTDGDSGDGSKAYYDEGDSNRKSRKTSEPPPSPKNKRPRESRGRNLSPPPKRRRVPRKKSPEELSRPFNYRGPGRSSSSRKGQSGSDTHEVIKAPPPPPVNLGKPPKSTKFNFIPELGGITDPDERVTLIMQAISSLRETYNEIKVKQQTIERRIKRRKKKERERGRRIRNQQKD